MATRLSSLWWAANIMASQLEPSPISPSPSTTKVRQPCAWRFAASALPVPNGSPCPSEPVENSTPATLWLIWFISTEWSLPYSSNSCCGKKPVSANAAYTATQAWPLLRIKRSRCGSAGCAGSSRITCAYRTATISHIDSADPIWEALALCTICRAWIRMRRAKSWLSSLKLFINLLFRILAGPLRSAANGVIQADTRNQPQLFFDAGEVGQIRLWYGTLRWRLGNANAALATEGLVDTVCQIANGKRLGAAYVVGATVRRLKQHHPQPMGQIGGVKVAAQRGAIALDVDILALHGCTNEVADRKVLVQRQMGANKGKAAGDGHFQRWLDGRGH